MKLTHLTLLFATVAATAGCATERAVAPSSASTSVRLGVSANAVDVPLLYVVDGIRLQRDEVPSLNADQVLSVSVMKGHLALQKFGPDAAYGVVVITTKARNAPQT